MVNNFRDVGATINELSDHILFNTNTLYRSSAPNGVLPIHGIQTIINLRRTPDETITGIDPIQIAPTEIKPCATSTLLI